MTKNKIIQAAIHQYSMHGYQGATMDKIATEVGIKPASIYFFFKNKKTLFTEACEKLLEDHLSQIKTIFEKMQNKPIETIFSSLLNGTIQYHKTHVKETNAYISLVTATPVEIQPFLHRFMQGFDDWLIASLIKVIKRDKPQMTDTEAETITRQFILLMDAVFWEINLYDDEDLERQINYALNIMNILLGGSVHAK